METCMLYMVLNERGAKSPFHVGLNRTRRDGGRRCLGGAASANRVKGQAWEMVQSPAEVKEG